MLLAIEILFLYSGPKWLKEIVHWPNWAGEIVFYLLNIALSLAFFCGGLQFLFRRTIRRHLYDELIAKGILVCIKCGYNLRGQTVPRCPECGMSFDKRMESP